MECAGPEIPNPVTRHYVLHWRVVCYDDRSDSAHENPHLDFASVCCRVRYSEVVSGEDLVMTALKTHTYATPDAVGNFITGPVYPVGRVWRTLSWRISLAMVGSA